MVHKGKEKPLWQKFGMVDETKGEESAHSIMKLKGKCQGDGGQDRLKMTEADKVEVLGSESGWLVTEWTGESRGVSVRV